MSCCPSHSSSLTRPFAPVPVRVCAAHGDVAGAIVVRSGKEAKVCRGLCAEAAAVAVVAVAVTVGRRCRDAFELLKREIKLAEEASRHPTGFLETHYHRQIQ